MSAGINPSLCSHFKDRKSITGNEPKLILPLVLSHILGPYLIGCRESLRWIGVGYTIHHVAATVRFVNTMPTAKLFRELYHIIPLLMA